MTKGNQHINTPFQRSYRVILVSSVLLINLFVIGLALYFLNNSYAQDQRLTEARTKNLSQVLTHAISGTIDKIDLDLLSITHEIEIQLSNNKIENLPLDHILSWNKEHMQEIHRLLVLNAQGELVSGSNGSNISQKNFADRDYFLLLRDNANEGLMISKPVLGVVGGKWVQVYARRFNNPDGSFAGIVAGSVSLEHFLKLFSSLSIGEHGSITLRDKELAVVARYPEPLEFGSTVGQKTISKEFQGLIESGKTSMTYKATYPVDHIERICTFNKIFDYPLYITVAMATSDILKAWHQKVRWVIGFVSILFMITFFSAWILNRKWLLEQQSAIEMISLTNLLNKTGELARLGGWEIELATMELYWSEQVFRIHQINPETIISVENAIGFYQPEAQPIIRKAVKLLIESGASFDLELQINTAMNDPLWVRIKGEAEHLEGKIVKVFGTLQDITALKLAAIELKKKNVEIEQFLYSVSHDLRTPLVTVKTFMGFLENDLAENNQERIAVDINYINSASDKMRMLLDELLELSRVERVELSPVKVPLKELLAEVLDTLAGVIAERNVDIQLPDTNPMLFGSRQRLCQIWQNLIENAIKFSSDNSILCVEIGVQQVNGETVFCVKDNGIGISSEYLTKIFGIFEKLNPKSAGAGMGLTIIQRIVENNGGRIWGESEGYCKGSCFFFTLPNVVVQV